MLIDWFTVGAQVLNFGVLVWLMQRYLYRPVLEAIDAREKLIATELADAAAMKKEAGDARDALDARNTAFDAQRAGLLTAATEAAAVERKRLLDTAAGDADAAADERRHALHAETAALQRALGLRARQEVFAVARKTLADLASESLEGRICAVFVDRLRALDDTARAELLAAVAAATEPVTLRSAFELAEAQRTAIRQVLTETFALKTALRFETAPDLVAGVELHAGGQRLEWSIAHHLDGLRQSVDALVTEAAETPPPPAAPKREAESSTAVPARPVATVA